MVSWMCPIRTKPFVVATTVRVRDGETITTLPLLTDSRRATRPDAAGLPVLLADQDRTRWAGRGLISRPIRRRRSGT